VGEEVEAFLDVEPGLQKRALLGRRQRRRHDAGEALGGEAL
jgi:hypothetical protein